MPFSRRLMLFGVGILFGCLIAYVIFYNNRDYPTWLPNDRLQQKFIEDSLVVTDLTVCYFECLGINEEQFKQSMTEVQVDFSKSKVRDVKNKKYFLSIVLNGKTLQMEIIARSDNYELSKILSGADQCACS